MPSLNLSATQAPPAPSSPGPGAFPERSPVFLPKEHGSWSLAFEPLALGLLAAPSPAGGALATAALAGFFLRRPLKVALAPGSAVRRRDARETVVMLSALAVAGLFESLVFGGLTALWPLLLAAPFGGLFVHFDARNDSRAAGAELAGSAAFAFLPAAFATLAGWPWRAALALAALALARSVPAVLTVRACLRLGRRRSADVLTPLAAAILALGVLGYLAAQPLVPRLAVGLAALLLLRTVFFVTPLRPAWPARRVGLIEAVLGVIYVGTLVLAYRLS